MEHQLPVLGAKALDQRERRIRNQHPLDHATRLAQKRSPFEPLTS
jgi:hypothetical protein